MSKRKSSSVQDAGRVVKAKTTTDNDVARELNGKVKILDDLPGFFAKLHSETREALQNAYNDDDLSGIYDYRQDLLEKGNAYRTAKAWSEASAKLGQSVYLAGGIADGDLVVLFMSIGNGDCILIRTPAGNVIVIDCGTRKRPEGEYRKHIQDFLKTHFLKKKVAETDACELYALILTHPDQDHYNELVPIVEPAITSIRHLFHSGSLDTYTVDPTQDKSLVATTSTTPTGSVTQKFLCSKAIFKNRISINSGVVKCETAGDTKDPVCVPGADGKSFKILDEGVGEAKCEIFLLAGEVSEENSTDRAVLAKDTRQGRDPNLSRNRYAKLLKVQGRGVGEDSNSGSLVTLIKAYNKKLLLCGDATYLTEIYLLNNHRETIRDVELAQMQHHGSGTAHAGGVYVETINPLFAVASAGTHEGDWNPRWRAIEKYLGLKKRKRRDLPQETRPVRLKQNVETHLLECNDEAKAPIPYDQWKPHEQKGLYSTRSNGDVCFVLKPTGELTLDASKAKTT